MEPHNLYPITWLVSTLVVFGLCQKILPIPKEMEHLKLNDSIIPSHYDLELRIVLDADTSQPQFEVNRAYGKVKILGVNQFRTSRIVLHASNLAIDTASCSVVVKTEGAKNPHSRQMKITEWEYDSSRDFFLISLDNFLDAAAHLEIYMEYTAVISEEKDNKFGLFLQTYTPKGKRESGKLCVAQLTNVHDFRQQARRMLPCFDEPHLKATFDLTIITQLNYLSISTTKRLSTVDDVKDGWARRRFVRTSEIAPSALSLLVADFGLVYQNSFGNGKMFRVHAPRHEIVEGVGNITAQIGAEVFSFFEGYYGNGSVQKMDMIFNQNWTGYSVEAKSLTSSKNVVSQLRVYGRASWILQELETRRDEYDLLEQMTKSVAELQYQGCIIGLQCQNSIGNQETDTYFTKGLHHHISSTAITSISTRRRLSDSIFLNQFHYAYPLNENLDGHLAPSLSKMVEFLHKDFRNSKILLEKGAALMNMIEGILTETTMKKGIQAYFKDISRKPSNSEQVFFDHLESVGKEDNRVPGDLKFGDFLKDWFHQGGYPVVKVSAMNATHVVISQERVRWAGVTGKDKNLWHIPITIYTQDDPDGKWDWKDLRNSYNNFSRGVFWLKNDGVPLVLEHDTNKWIMANANNKGYYRTKYDDKLLGNLDRQLNDLDFTVIPIPNRRRFLDDYFFFAKEGYVRIDSALNLTRYTNEETFEVWIALYKHLEEILSHLSTHPEAYLFEDYVQIKYRFSSTFQNLPTGTGRIAELERDLYLWSCKIPSRFNSDCHYYSRRLFSEWQDNPHSYPIPSTLPVWKRNILECNIVASADVEAFEFMLSQYKRANNDTRESTGYHKALGCTPHVRRLEKLLNASLNSHRRLEKHHVYETLQVFLARHPKALEIALSLLSDHIDLVLDTPEVLWRIFTNFKFTTQQQLQETQAFFARHKEQLGDAFEQLEKQVNAQALVSISWMNGTGRQVLDWTIRISTQAESLRSESIVINQAWGGHHTMWVSVWCSSVILMCSISPCL